MGFTLEEGLLIFGVMGAWGGMLISFYFARNAAKSASEAARLGAKALIREEAERTEKETESLREMVIALAQIEENLIGSPKSEDTSVVAGFLIPRDERDARRETVSRVLQAAPVTIIPTLQTMLVPFERARDVKAPQAREMFQSAAHSLNREIRSRSGNQSPTT